MAAQRFPNQKCKFADLSASVEEAKAIPKRRLSRKTTLNSEGVSLPQSVSSNAVVEDSDMVSAADDLSVDVKSRKRKQQMASETHTHLGLPEQGRLPGESLRPPSAIASNKRKNIARNACSCRCRCPGRCCRGVVTASFLYFLGGCFHV